MICGMVTSLPSRRAMVCMATSERPSLTVSGMWKLAEWSDWTVNSAWIVREPAGGVYGNSMAISRADSSAGVSGELLDDGGRFQPAGAFRLRRPGVAGR